MRLNTKKCFQSGLGAAARSEQPEEVVLEGARSIKLKRATSLWRLLYLPHKAQFSMFKT